MGHLKETMPMIFLADPYMAQVTDMKSVTERFQWNVSKNGCMMRKGPWDSCKWEVLTKEENGPVGQSRLVKMRKGGWPIVSKMLQLSIYWGEGINNCDWLGNTKNKFIYLGKAKNNFQGTTIIDFLPRKSWHLCTYHGKIDLYRAKMKSQMAWNPCKEKKLLR